MGGIQTEITEFLKTNDNENIVYQNLLDIFKVLIRGNFIALNIFVNKNERMKINEPDFQIKI